MRLRADVVRSFVGNFGVALDEAGVLVRASFLRENGREAFTEIVAQDGDELTWDAEACAPVRAELEEYFAGERTDFALPFELRGTEFQQRVWQELVRIPYGETISYGELAHRVGQAGGSRAVGQANHVNPVPIVVPCHRVIGADGSLTGFGGGVETKRQLLDFEKGQGGLPFG